MESGGSAGEATPPPKPPPPQQPPAPRPSPADKEEKSKETFRDDVRNHFTVLVAQGLEPNDAAALALKLAAKIGARRHLQNLIAFALGSSPTRRTPSPESSPEYFPTFAPSLPIHFGVVTILSRTRPSGSFRARSSTLLVNPCW